jgi:amidophosphoribosyltransferase
MPSRRELIAATHTEQQIRDYLGVDALLYQSQADLVEAVTRRGDHNIVKPCMACMDGEYVCGNITEAKISDLEQKRAMEKA